MDVTTVVRPIRSQVVIRVLDQKRKSPLIVPERCENDEVSEHLIVGEVVAMSHRVESRFNLGQKVGAPRHAGVRLNLSQHPGHFRLVNAEDICIEII